MRLAPTFFPFVEPGVDCAVSCAFCEKGCRICSFSGWIEIMGAGMVHPNVLAAAGIDPSATPASLRDGDRPAHHVPPRRS
ncbi:MAG: hypothetical protein IPP07_29330 [Holophagales bacterium]|nr:hypothetical protein [Holophagales bacterium]